MLSTSERCDRQSAKTPNTRFWLARNKIASRHSATQIGGSVRGYQGLPTPLAIPAMATQTAARSYFYASPTLA